MSKKVSSYDIEFMKSFHGMSCLICGSTFGIHGEHLKTKGSGGADEYWNVWPTCLKHHNEKGNKGVCHMANTYPKFKEWLITNGWYYSEFLDKWRNDTSSSNSSPTALKLDISALKEEMQQL